ncbi:MAG: class I SAM-dependent methyltransferase [Candidatus Hermodarchaeota archaeon]
MYSIPSGEDKISKVASVVLTFLQKVLIKSNQYTFLDIGCGDGRDIDFITSNLDNLIIRGIDISLKAIENAISLNLKRYNVNFECMDWKDLDDTPYDIVYSSGLYHFFNITDRITFISKINKILNPHGYFFLSTLSSNDTQYYGKGLPVENDPNSFQSEFFLHFSSEDELREDFKFLKIVDLFDFYHKNYAKDIDYHTMTLLIGKKGTST